MAWGMLIFWHHVIVLAKLAQYSLALSHFSVRAIIDGGFNDSEIKRAERRETETGTKRGREYEVPDSVEWTRTKECLSAWACSYGMGTQMWTIVEWICNGYLGNTRNWRQCTEIIVAIIVITEAASILRNGGVQMRFECASLPIDQKECIQATCHINCATLYWCRTRVNTRKDTNDNAYYGMRHIKSITYRLSLLLVLLWLWFSFSRLWFEA